MYYGGVARDLRTELKQRRPFRSLGHEAHLGILRTAAELEHAFETALKPYGLTATQYNVLRILRGAGPDGLCRHEIRTRMVRRVPDVTRLLDRMEDLELILRVRGGDDRRFVTARITPAGLRKLAALDPVADQLTDTLLGHLGNARLRALIDLLGTVRERT
jgi:DNA-binding MarR family transcriptional regulator